MDYLNPIAEEGNPDSGRLFLPSEAYPLRNERCFFCPDFDCKDPSRVLIPVVSGKGNFFFRHKGNFKHDIRPETLLHKSAIKWFVGKTEYEIPTVKSDSFSVLTQTIQIDATKTICEYRRLLTIIPDVKVLTINGFEFAIEVVVTHDMDDYKKKVISQFGIPVVRVDLSSFYKRNKRDCQCNLEFIQSNLDRLMTDLTLKSWVVSPTLDQVQGKLNWIPVEKILPQKSDNNSDVGCLLVIITLGIVYLFKKK